MRHNVYLNSGRVLSVVLSGILATLVAARPGRADESVITGGGGDTVTFEDHVAPFLKDFCARCHGSRRQRANLDFEAFGGPESVERERRTWVRMLHMLREREMPPENREQPSERERARIAAWIEAELQKYDCSGQIDPGRVTARRLNRAEYDNTVRDLLGVGSSPSESFPADDVGYGFDNIGDVLSMPPLLAEKYLEAAEKVVDEAMEREREFFVHERFEAEDSKLEAPGNPYGLIGLSINREGEAWVKWDVPTGGEYIFRVRAWGQQAGPEVVRLGLRLDGEQIERFDVPAVEAEPGIYETRHRVEAGEHRLAVAYLNNYVNNSHPDPKLRGDRNMLVDWWEVELVREREASPAEVRRFEQRLFVCRPAHSGEEASCAEKILTRFLRRAFRRPPTPEEIDRHVELALEAREDGDSFEQAIALAVKAALVSPHFLFRVEEEADPDRPAVVEPVDDFDLASRLSYFLWSSMPDEELLDLAAAGKLRDPGVLEAQAMRLLEDPRSEALVDNFAAQWLQTRGLQDLSPDPELFPSFDDALRAAMERETLLFFEEVLRQDRSVLEFLDADYTFVNERLAKHYGIDGVEGDAFRRISLEGTARGGLLTQASILTQTSNPTRTSPVKRGKWVLEQMLGTPPPPPPPDVEELSEEPEAILSGSLRQRMEKHREDPNCGICHSKMDPIGFAFENFDAIGAFREFDGEFLIDPSGELPDGSRFDGPEELKQVLLQRKHEFARNLAEKLLTYALGRGLEYFDRCAVDGVVEELEKHEYRFSALVRGVVKSDPFRKRRGGVAEP